MPAGILNWALEGLALWQAHGLEDPKVVEYVTKEYRADQDVIAHFISDRCSQDNCDETEAHELYNAYKSWTVSTGEFTMNERAFSNAMGDRGFDKGRRNFGMVWKGIDLLLPEAPL